MANELKSLFDAYYYAHCCGRPYGRQPEWFAFFGQIAERIATDIRPRKVLDAGCAIGLLVEELRNRGVEAFGVDISEYAISQVHESIRSFCWTGSVCDPFPEKYDLVVTIEVLEHMPKTDAEKALHNICQSTDDVLFSSSPFDYKEVTHFNVQPPEYWAELFARQGFFRDVDYDASFMTPWAARFRRRSDPNHLLIKDYERQFWLLWKENTDLRSLNLDMRNENNGLQILNDNLQAENKNLQIENQNLNQLVQQLQAMDAQRVMELQAIQGELANIRGSKILQLAMKARDLKRQVLK